MYYLRKWWLGLLFILGMGMTVLHYGYRLVTVIISIIFRFSQLDMNEYNLIDIKIQKFSDNGFDLLLTILLIVVFVLICWFISNLTSGQLQRDFLVDRLTKSLIRYVPTGNTKLIAEEEKRANWWIRRGRIIKKHGKLVLRIPCGNNAAVIEIIRKRCDGYVNQWLSQNYPNSNWSPLEIKHGLFITWLYVKEK